jgi:hypothetical protein
MSKENQTPTSSMPPNATQGTNPFAAFDPMTAWTASQAAFQKMFTDAQSRAQAFVDEYATLEAQMVARAKTAIETWSQLAQEALAYSAQLSAQARKLGLETARKMNAGA